MGLGTPEVESLRFRLTSVELVWRAPPPVGEPVTFASARTSSVAPESPPSCDGLLKPVAVEGREIGFRTKRENVNEAELSVDWSADVVL